MLRSKSSFRDSRSYARATFTKKQASNLLTRPASLATVVTFDGRILAKGAEAGGRRPSEHGPDQKGVIRGARQHNLKNINLEIPRNGDVITGFPVSGKILSLLTPSTPGTNAGTSNRFRPTRGNPGSKMRAPGSGFDLRASARDCHRT